MTAAANKKLVEDAYACFFKGDLAGFVKPFGKDGCLLETESLPYGGVYKGGEQIIGLLKEFGRLWNNLSFEIRKILSDDDTVMVYGDFSATANVSGARVSFPIVEHWKIKNGQVSEMRVIYSDTWLVNNAQKFDPTKRARS